MPLLGELVVAFSADLTSFTEGITQAQASLNDFGSQVDAISTLFTSALTNAAATGSTGVAEAMTSAATAVDSSDSSIGATLSSLWANFSEGASVVGEFASSIMESLSEAGAGVAEFATGIVESLQEGYRSFVEFGMQIGETVNSLTEMQFAGFRMVQSLVGTSAEMEQTQIAFKTLLGSSKAAGDYLTQLWNFAAKTPFQFQNLASASQQLLAFGFKAKDTIPDLTTMGDALSAMGRTDAGSLQQIVGVFGRIQAAGKVNAMDMNMLTFLGIPGWKYLAQAMHLTVEQVQQLSKTGKLTATDVIPDLLKGMHGAFGGAMAAQAETFNGLLTTVKDNLIAAWRTASGPLFEQAKAAMKAFGDLAGSPAFQNGAKVIATILGGAFTTIGAILSSVVMPAFHAFQAILVPVGAAFQQAFGGAGAGSGLAASLGDLRTAITNILSFLEKASSDFGSFKINMSAIEPVVSALANGAIHTLSSLFESLATHINTLQAIIASLIPVFVHFGALLLQNILPPLGKLAQAFAGTIVNNMKIFGQMFEQIASWIQTQLAPAIGDLLPHLAELAGAIISNVVPALMSFWHLGQVIVGAVLPPLIGIIETLVPWILTLAGVLSVVLTAAFNVVGPLVSGLVNGLASLIEFFQQNEVAGALLKGVLITLAIPLALIAMVLLPMLIADMIGSLIGAIAGAVVGFIAWGVAAWTAAVGVIAATWPILLIILAIAALIAITILIIQHWSQISAFFVGVWNAIKQAFAGMGEWFGQQFDKARDAVGKAFSNLGSFMHDTGANIKNGFQQGVGDVGQWFADRGKDITNAAQSIGQGVINAGNWMYNHNYYWKLAVDTITNAITVAKKWLSDTWKDITQGIAIAWAWLSQVAKDVWNLIVKTIMDVVTPIVVSLENAWNTVYINVGSFWNMIGSTIHSALLFIQTTITVLLTTIVNWIIEKWTYAHAWIAERWGQLKGLAAAAWAAVSAVFSSIWSTYVSGPLQSLWTMVSGWFTGFGTMALQSGQNFIQMLVSGIESGVGDIWNAVQNIAGTIWKALGFHSPPEGGPLSDSDRYMPNFIDMMVMGLNTGVPKIQKASYNVASALSGVGPLSSSVGTNASFFAQSAAQSASSQSGTANIYVQLDSKLIGQATGQPLIDEIRLRTGLLI